MSYPVCLDDLYQRVSLIPNGITVFLLYLAVDRTGCFGVSDQPSVNAAMSISSKAPITYHLGVRLGQTRRAGRLY